MIISKKHLNIETGAWGSLNETIVAMIEPVRGSHVQSRGKLEAANYRRKIISEWFEP